MLKATSSIVVVAILLALIWSIYSDSNTYTLTQNALIEESQFSENQNYLYVVIIVLSLTTLLSVLVSFYLYKWRKVLLTNRNMAVPEEWVKHLINLSDGIEGLMATSANQAKSFANELMSQRSSITEMTKTYMELRAAIDKKDNEIERLKKGYDAQVFKSFILRFARVQGALEESIADDEINLESFKMLKVLFDDAFEECGVTKIVPEIGSNYTKSADLVADNPKVTITDDPEKNFLIEEVLSPAYVLTSSEIKQVLVPAKVKINKYIQKDAK